MRIKSSGGFRMEAIAPLLATLRGIQKTQCIDIKVH